MNRLSNWTDVESRVKAKGGVLLEDWDLVLPENQRGQTCGFYCLYWSMCHLHDVKSEGPKHSPIPPTWGYMYPGSKPDDGKVYSLRQLGKNEGVTRIGEVWRPQQLADMAKLAGYKKTFVKDAKRGSLGTAIRAEIDAGYSPIVGIDVDGTSMDTMRPVTSLRGAHAHWVNVIGYYKGSTSPRLIICTYGEYFAWKEEELVSSNNQLQVFSGTEIGKDTTSGEGLDYQVGRAGTFIPTAVLTHMQDRLVCVRG